jgi:hypothetical protein
VERATRCLQPGFSEHTNRCTTLHTDRFSGLGPDQ